MNIAYITFNNNNGERHFIEHVIICKVYNYDKDFEFFKSFQGKDIDVMGSVYYDFMHISFCNINDKRLIKLIDRFMENYNFSRKDYLTEKRVLKIETSQLDIKNEKDWVKYLFKKDKYQTGYGKSVIDNMTYSKLLNIKNNTKFKKVLFEDYEVKSNKKLNKLKIINSKINSNCISLQFLKNENLWELFILLRYFFDISKYYAASEITLSEYTLIIDNNYKHYINKVLKSKTLFNNNFDKAYIKYMEDRVYFNKDKASGYRKNTVNYKMTSSVNIYKMYDKQKIKDMLRDLLLVIYEYKV